MPRSTPQTTVLKHLLQTVLLSLLFYVLGSQENSREMFYSANRRRLPRIAAGDCEMHCCSVQIFCPSREMCHKVYLGHSRMTRVGFELRSYAVAIITALPSTRDHCRQTCRFIPFVTFHRLLLSLIK